MEDGGLKGGLIGTVFFGVALSQALRAGHDRKSLRDKDRVGPKRALCKRPFSYRAHRPNPRHEAPEETLPPDLTTMNHEP
jgi:hypothetical protein